MTMHHVLTAYALVLRLSKARRQPAADVERLDRLVRRAVERAERKQRKLEARG